MKIKRNDKLLAITIATFSVIITSIGLAVIPLYAQEIDTQKSFLFGENPDDVLMDRKYEDGSEISYSTTGYPSVVVTILHWNNIGTLERNLIRTQLVTEGYEEQPEIDSQTGIIRDTIPPR